MYSCWKVEKTLSRIINRLPPLRGRKELDIAIGVSGGSDSIALVLFLRNLRNLQYHDYRVSRILSAVTVDHRLRPESQLETQFVRQKMIALPFTEHLQAELNPPDVLRSNLSKAMTWARENRYSSLNSICIDSNVDIVCTGHHAGDQLETFLMRTFRGSGMYGLRATDTMIQIQQNKRLGRFLVRPLLNVNKFELLQICMQHNISPVKDPSNYDKIFDRVRSRNGVLLYNDIGISKLKRLFSEIESHSQVIQDQISKLAVAILVAGNSHLPYVVIDVKKILALSESNIPTGHAVFALYIKKVGGGRYPPSRRALVGLFNSLKLGIIPSPVNRCIFKRKNNMLYLCQSPPVSSERKGVMRLSRRGRMYETSSLMNKHFSYSISINCGSIKELNHLCVGVGMLKNRKTSYDGFKWPLRDYGPHSQVSICIYMKTIFQKEWAVHACPHKEQVQV